MISLEGVETLLNLMDRHGIIRMKYGDFEVERIHSAVPVSLPVLADPVFDKMSPEERKKHFEAEMDKDLYGA